MKPVAVTLGLIATVGAFDGGNKPKPEPVEKVPLFTDVTPAQYSEYDRTSNNRCDGPRLRVKECWEDNEGVYFRYGCMKDDGVRVLTQRCGDSCGGCDGLWTWGGEQQNTCYDDGEQLYSFACGGSAVPVAEEPAAAVSVGSESSCAELGWPLAPGSTMVCGFSKVFGGKCSEGDYTTAAAECAAVGARLCSAAELANDETKGTGCKGDCAPIWSSDTCTTESGAAGHIHAAGAKKCAKKVPATCAEDSSAMNTVRCCADVSTESSETVAFPSGFSPAVSNDYNLADGNCGVNRAIATYSCWTNPSDNMSMRFACSDTDNYIYHQFCGSSSQCDPSSCSGEWAKTGEVAGQCYTRKSEGYVYQYSCPEK